MKKTRAGGLVAASALTLTAALGAPAEAQVEQDGLVNVNVGNVTILEDVRVGVAAQLAAQLCDVTVGPVVILGRAVDRSGDKETICRSDQGRVTITQN